MGFPKHRKREQNGRLHGNDIFKCILLNENVGGLIQISLMFIP